MNSLSASGLANKSDHLWGLVDPSISHLAGRRCRRLLVQLTRLIPLGYRTEYTLERGWADDQYIRQREPKPFKYHINLEIITEKTPVTWVKNIRHRLESSGIQQW